jgi:hypothetical protein
VRVGGNTKARTVTAFLAAGGMAKLVSIVQEHTPPMRAVAGYVLSQLVVSGRCWEECRGARALAAPLFQAVVESLSATIAGSWEGVTTPYHTSPLATIVPTVAPPGSLDGGPSPTKERSTEAAAAVADGEGEAAAAEEEAEAEADPFAVFAAMPPPPPTPKQSKERREEARRAAAAAAAEETSLGTRRAAQQWARQGQTLWACAQQAVRKPPATLVDCFKDLLQVSITE